MGSLWILVASMVKQSPGAPHAACSVDAIVEECAATAHGCGEKTRSKTTSVLGKACAIQQRAYPSRPGKWHVHLASENSRALIAELPESFPGLRQKLTTKHSRNHQPTAHS